MIGENFKRLNRGQEIKEVKERIYDLQNMCGQLYYSCRDTGIFDYEKHDYLVRQIEKLEDKLYELKGLYM